jgi:hypothetical protein
MFWLTLLVEWFPEYSTHISQQYTYNHVQKWLVMNLLTALLQCSSRYLSALLEPRCRQTNIAHGNDTKVMIDSCLYQEYKWTSAAGAVVESANGQYRRDDGVYFNTASFILGRLLGFC